jgi:hypothetical protein
VVVAGQLGRALILAAWLLCGIVGAMGALGPTELTTRLPQAGGKHVFALKGRGRLERADSGHGELASGQAAVIASGQIYRLAGLGGATLRF